MGQRASRVAEELRKVITQILLEELSDPRLGFVTVTRVEVTDDLRHGRVFYSVLGSEEQKTSTAEALREELGNIRRMVASNMELKFAIDVHFELDESIDHSFRIDSILKKIKKPEEE
jgi:ribosome-binding factor A